MAIDAVPMRRMVAIKPRDKNEGMTIGIERAASMHALHSVPFPLVPRPLPAIPQWPPIQAVATCFCSRTTAVFAGVGSRKT
jgi:hypothetical protein